MSFRKKSLLFLFVFLLIVVGLLYWRKSWVASIKAKDYVALETEILLPDTDGKGFSDKVKKDIDENFSDELIRKTLYKFAATKRTLARSKTEKEFIDNSKKSSIVFECVLYLEYDLKKDIFKNVNPRLTQEIVYDNKDMENFIKFLDKYRFGSAEFDVLMSEFVNKTQIYSKSEYDKLCGK